MNAILTIVELLTLWLSVIDGQAYDVVNKKKVSVDSLLNTCLDGRNHKTKPGPESKLFNHCTPWKERSCCTAETSQGFHLETAWLNFDWNHCGTLSPKCHAHFVKDLCFYECSPNIGPYLQLDDKKIRNNTYKNVPMCETTCQSWWNDCKADITCTNNWAKNFNWTTGINKCPTNSSCQTFEEVFGDSTRFCEGLWDGAFKVVSNEEDCFKLWFAEDENPNEAVARKEASRILGIPLSNSVTPSFLISPFSLPLLLLSVYLHLA